MTQWSGKTRGGVSGYKFIVFILKHLNIKIAYFFLRFVALYFLIFSDKKGIRFYFKEILGYKGFKVTYSIYQNYCFLGQVLIDKIAFLAGFKSKFTFTFEGEEHLRRMASEGTGGLLIGAHMGNWEVAGQLLERIETPINIVMLEAEHEKIGDFLKEVMVKKNIKIIGIKNDFSHLFEIAKAFENKEIVAIHGDRFLPGTNTVEINFMGKPALFPTGPLYLASKHGVPVTFVITVKDTSTHYHFYATEGKVYPYPSKLKTRKEEIKNMVEDYAQKVEFRLRQYPLQWFNYYQFWENK